MLNNLILTEFFIEIIIPAFFATVRMVIATMIIGFEIGFLLAILLFLYGEGGLNPKKHLYNILDFIINSIRSFPTLIFIVAFFPVTRLIVGTTVGEKAVIVPLSIIAMAFIARALENSFKEVDKQLIEAAQSFGASNFQIIFGVIVKESVPSIVSIATMSTISFIANSTIAGAVGGGGLGSVAINYGYQSFNDIVLYECVTILFFMVLVVQKIGNYIYKKVL